MCIIIAKKSGAELPTKEILKRCDDKNPHGIGICYKLPNGKVRIKKDFVTVEGLYDYLTSKITLETELIIHFRIATSGLRDEGNRHPFAVVDDCMEMRKVNSVVDCALAHNGILSQYGRHATYSDTMKFIKHIMSKDIVKNNIMDTTIQELIIGTIGSDKLAIMNKEHFILLGTFIESGGLYYSNRDFEYALTRWSGFGHKKINKGLDYCADCFKLDKLIYSPWHQDYICQNCLQSSNVKGGYPHGI